MISMMFEDVRVNGRMALGMLRFVSEGLYLCSSVNVIWFPLVLLLIFVWVWYCWCCYSCPVIASWELVGVDLLLAFLGLFVVIIVRLWGLLLRYVLYVGRHVSIEVRSG